MVDLIETVNAAQDGCPHAFDDLVRATYDDTYSLALRLVGNADDAQDVTQDTYLRAFRGIGRFRGEANIATWLYRITSNCASTVLARRRKAAHDQLDADDALVDDRLEHDPERRLDSAALRDRVVLALGQLPEKLRSVIVLRDVYDLSHDAIARQLGITESAAKVRLHRARQKLRSTLFDDPEEPSQPLMAGPETDGASEHSVAARPLELVFAARPPGVDAGARLVSDRERSVASGAA